MLSDSTGNAQCGHLKIYLCFHQQTQIIFAFPMTYTTQSLFTEFSQGPCTATRVAVP